jgi:hypothetical protein
MIARPRWTQVSFFMLFAASAGCTVTSAKPDASDGSGGSSSTSSGGSNGSGSGGSNGSGSGGSTQCPDPKEDLGGHTPDASKLPCDVYEADGGPCVAAHSTVRLLTKKYTGPLYQVRKATDNTFMDIGVGDDGLAKSEDQESFCGVDACFISKIYDQSGKKNDLTKSPPGMAKPTENEEASAKGISIMIGSKKVYGIHIVTGIGYRNNSPSGTATGDDPETEYMVVQADYYNASCCFDYGNMETTSRDDGEGTMEAVYFGNCTVWNRGADKGPWVMGDLENGLWAGDSSPYNCNKSVTSFKYVTGMVKGDKAGMNHWTIKLGDAQSGGLMVPFDGKRPDRYNPMKKQGAIGLGTGGDNSSSARGNFFEGVMTNAYSSKNADADVQANIVSVYSKIQ